MSDASQDDVLILGSGLGGSLLACCLAAQGLQVRMVDAGMHPRFAIGEATTPDTSFRFKLLALRYGVPELAALGAHHRLARSAGPSSGLKRGFSFLYHRAGELPDPQQSHQYPTLAPPFGPDLHMYRQDVDAWMMTLAMRYGVRVHQGWRCEHIELEDEGVTLRSVNGERLRGRFLVDAAGFGAPLVKQLGLRQPGGLRTDSRAMFTHMLGVRPYDALLPGGSRGAGLRYPLHQTTLHHVFPGGWMWVIPFGNHRGAVNPLTSVGLVLDRRRYPERGLRAEEELQEFMDRFPGVKSQLEHAVPVRPWVSTGRLQFTARQTVGDRWALMAHAAGFVDPLFSSGLSQTCVTVDLLTRRLVQACAEDRFEREHFLPVEQALQASLHQADALVANAYDAFDDFELWDAWYRVWVIGLLVATAANGNLVLRAREGMALGAQTEAPALTRSLGRGVPACGALLDACFSTIEGEGSPGGRAQTLRELLRASDCSPDYWRWQDPSVRCTPAFTLGGMTRMYLWFRMNAPKELVQQTFAWRPDTAYRAILAELLRHRRERRLAGRALIAQALRPGPP